MSNVTRRKAQAHIELVDPSSDVETILLGQLFRCAELGNIDGVFTVADALNKLDVQLATSNP
jgi:hypothetical protein